MRATVPTLLPGLLFEARRATRPATAIARSRRPVNREQTRNARSKEPQEPFIIKAGRNLPRRKPQTATVGIWTARTNATWPCLVISRDINTITIRPQQCDALRARTCPNINALVRFRGAELKPREYPMPHVSNCPTFASHPIKVVARTARSLATGVGLGLILWVAGCGASKSGSPIGLATPGEWADEMSVDVKNDLGEVSIQVDVRLTAPLVYVRRFGEFGGDPIDAQGVSITREGGSSGQTLKVVAQRVTYPAAASFLRPGRRALSIEIRTPRVFGVIVQNSGGRVLLGGVGGPIQVNNGIGADHSVTSGSKFADRARVVVRTSQPMREPIDITSGDGGIELEIPQDSDLELAVAGAKGRPTVFAPMAGFTQVRNDPAAWSATLGDGSAPAQLKASGGPVRIEITSVKTRRPPR